MSDNAVMFEEQPSYDAVGNVTGVSTTLPTGTDNQKFCYDEQNRLTWSGSTGTPSCGGTLTPGSLTSARYTQTFTYDNLDRITSGVVGSYTYGDSAHKHAVTSASAGYGAAYDASGDQTCRAPNGSGTTCSGTQTGAQLTYDNEGRLTTWQASPGNTTNYARYLYDGQGQRVMLAATKTGGSPATTVYVGGLEEIVSAGTTTTYSYYPGPNGKPIAEAVSGSLFYLATDHLGTPEVTLQANGTTQASALYSPYGLVRYASGTMLTDVGFTGQVSDAGSSGLDYYRARYYDPVSSQFGSADTKQDGLNRFAYVHGNPATLTDPTGHSVGAGCIYDQNDDGVYQWFCPTGHGSGAGSNGSKAKTGYTRDCSRPGAHPTCDQIDSAKANARSAVDEFQSFYGLNIRALGILGVLAAGVLRLTGPMPGWLTWVPGALTMWTVLAGLATALLAAVSIVMGELELAATVFAWESHQPDSFWESPSALQDLKTRIETVGTLLNLYLTVSAVIALGFLSNPTSFVVGALIGIAAAGLVGIVKVVPDMVGRIEAQQQILGYLL